MNTLSMNFLPVMLVAALILANGSLADDEEQNIATLRGAPINVEVEPPKMADVENKDIKRARNYPMQPPTIPHKVRDYRVDLNSNKCLSCHSRKQTAQSQAPMISVTHYMDREGNFLADVSPRRYFCEQCHVVQTNAPALVESDFKDIDQLLREAQ
ncbi:MAG: nitrate reductase cytochrome c-type subunit [Halioglobus sp.]